MWDTTGRSCIWLSAAVEKTWAAYQQFKTGKTAPKQGTPATADTCLRLVVGGGGEDLGLLGGDGGVAADQLGHDAAQRLNALLTKEGKEHRRAFVLEG